MAVKKGTEIATIDVNLVTILVDGDDTEIAIDTASKVGVTPETETTDAVKVIVKGVLKAQKPEEVTVTGNAITLTDNVFIPEVAVALQGGEITKDFEGNITGYNPPNVGEIRNVTPFTLKCYSAQYNAAGNIVQYECIEYPNCKGQPIALSSEDGAFRAPEYTINSAPNTGEPPYKITYVDSLPEVSK